MISQKDLKTFQRLWSKFDRKGIGMIKYSDIEQLIKELEGIFQVEKNIKKNSKIFFKFIGNLILPLYFKVVKNDENRVCDDDEPESEFRGKRDYYFHYYDILLALARYGLIKHRGKKYKE